MQHRPPTYPDSWPFITGANWFLTIIWMIAYKSSISWSRDDLLLSIWYVYNSTFNTGKHATYPSFNECVHHILIIQVWGVIDQWISVIQSSDPGLINTLESLTTDIFGPSTPSLLIKFCDKLICTHTDLHDTINDLSLNLDQQYLNVNREN